MRNSNGRRRGNSHQPDQEDRRGRYTNGYGQSYSTRSDLENYTDEFDRENQSSRYDYFDPNRNVPGYSNSENRGYERGGSRYSEGGQLTRGSYENPRADDEAGDWGFASRWNQDESRRSDAQQGLRRSSVNYQSRTAHNQGQPGLNSNNGTAHGEHWGKGPKGYQRSDERILENINDRLSDHGEIDASEIEVKVEQGEVTLTGTVTSKDEKRRAEDTVELISGVKNVENRLRVVKG